MAAFIVSSFGLFVMSLFAGLITAPSWQTFTVLAYGWAVASGERQTITTYLWLTGATTVKHFSCYYTFLGGALYQARWQLWARIIRCAAQWVPEATIRIVVDDSTKKKTGRQIEGIGHYRNGAGSARQEYRTLRGLNFVWGLMRVPVPGWPGQSVSVPIGLSLYLKEEQADKLELPYQTRSALAREIVDFVAAQLPTRRIRVLGDGGYATKEYLHQLPATVDVVSRMLITGKLYALPPLRRPAPRLSPEERALPGIPENLGPQTGGLAAPSHRSRGARASVDGAVAYRAAGATHPGGRGAPSAAAPRPQARSAQTVAPGGGVFHHRPDAESGSHPRTISPAVDGRNHHS